MSRYIDCDKCYHGRVCAYRHHYKDMITECSHYIPTADVVEVRHGYWISEEEAVQLDQYDLAYTCSICGHCDWDCTESENFNFCPNCGAKMDGERREEQ